LETLFVLAYPLLRSFRLPHAPGGLAAAWTRVQSGSFGAAGRRAFTLVELMVGLGILAFCFMPVISHITAGNREVEWSREEILARHYLMDMVERYKGATLDELRALPPTESNIELGQDPDYLKKDPLLGDRDLLVKEMQDTLRLTGYKDTGTAGAKQVLDLTKVMTITRMATFKESVGGPGVHELSCIIRWKTGTGGKNERRIDFTKVLVR
jgi:prepilin-type N-terminal cleavage/methylation domain-containing protein